MKATLEFDIENPDAMIREKERDKLKWAQKAEDMAWFIDKFLDWLLVIAPHVPMNELLERTYGIYSTYMEDAEINDVVQSDLQEVLETDQFYDCEGLDQKDEIIDKLRQAYIEKQLDQDLGTKRRLYDALKAEMEAKKK